ncbi:MAG: imidazoleglycerol-phosphate dehydratase HisB [Clostridia bacterium]|nr:imidazoleglycerol-phosphate dehydratase HisB [Clostridia bacterium]
MRTAEITRRTNETDIALTLNLDGSGSRRIDTGCGFFNHMLDLFAAHGGFDLTVRCKGDVDVDYHHTVEDIGIALGQALAQSLGEKRGIARYGSMLLPMDEVLMLCAADLSGRACLVFDVSFTAQKVGDFDTELVREFLSALVRASGLTLHVKELSGGNAHHTAEAVFKALGRALRAAAVTEGDHIPSTKGVLA